MKRAHRGDPTAFIDGSPCHCVQGWEDAGPRTLIAVMKPPVRVKALILRATPFQSLAIATQRPITCQAAQTTPRW